MKNVKLMNIIILGGPGCGKGTQAEKISQKFKIPVVSAGELLRQEKERGTELGKKIGPIIDKGEMVPNEWILNLIKKRLKAPDTERGAILDGFPRTMEQVKVLQGFFRPFFVIFLDAKDRALVLRQTGRRQCLKCKINYHLEFRPPKKDGICDKCGLELIVRDDAREEVIRKRLKIFKKETMPVINYFRTKKLLIVVDSNKSIEEVWQEILNRICSLT